jgi:hypothetical protein
LKMRIGEGRTGYEKKTYFKLKDGDTSFRIIPELGDLVDDGVWAKYYQIHYGYRNTKGNMVVFQSPLVQDRKTKMVEVPDKALERIDKLKAELAKAKEAGNTAMVERLMKLVGGQKAMYNLAKHHYINAIDTQGNIGILKIGHKCKLSLDAEIAKLKKGGTNPLSINNGRYFVFNRTGKGLDTTFQVTVLKEKLDVPGVGIVERDIVHVITPEILKRIEKEAAITSKEDDLDRGLDNLYPMFTAAEVEQIVAQSDILTGKSPALDAIQAKRKLADNAADADEGGEDDEAPQSAGAGTLTAAQTPTPAPTSIATQAPVIATPIATQAPIATPTPVQQTVTPTVQAAPTPSETPVQTVAAAAVTPAPSPVQTTAQNVASISDADFLASLNQPAQ